MSSQPLATEPWAPLSPRLNPVEASTQAEKCLHSEDATKPEKLLAFNLAFHTNTPYFEWLENGGEDPLGGTGHGARICTAAKTEKILRDDTEPVVPGDEPNCASGKPFRLQRFSMAMMGTAGWEAPKAILSGKPSTYVSSAVCEVMVLPIRIRLVFPSERLYYSRCWRWDRKHHNDSCPRPQRPWG